MSRVDQVRVGTDQIRLSWCAFSWPWQRKQGSGGDAERDAEAEIARNLWRHHWLLPPTSRWRTAWDWTLLLLVVFSSVQIPFVLSFRLAAATTEALGGLDWAIDAFFWVDMVLIFNTSYYIDEDLCTSRREIARRYSLGWFPIDLIATLPWEMLSSSLVSMRLLRLLRLSRVVKKVDQLKGGMALRFFYLIFWWMLIAHWTACLWWYIGMIGWEAERDDYFAGRVREGNETNWLVRIPPNGRVDFDPPFSSVQYERCWTLCVARSANTSAPQSPVQCMSSRECDDNNFNPEATEEVWNHWLSSFYWAFTMLMKTPYVGPDTLAEKIFSCLMVIVGAIIFALLLGQVTTLIISASRAGAALRDALVEYRLFCVTRLGRSRQSTKLYDLMAQQKQAEWQQTKGMDTSAVLDPFPQQLRGDVLTAVHAPLLEVNPPFLRCREQLRRRILELLRPAIALKKSNVIMGKQFTGTIYILMKGTLQVSPLPEAARTSETAADGAPQRTTTSKGGKKGGKNFKEKLKVRMLEKPGAMIPLENVREGAKASPFAVFAVTACQMLQLDAAPLMGVLNAFPAEDANVVVDAIGAEYKGLADSLKMTKPAADSAHGAAKVAEGPGIAGKVASMERRSNEIIASVERLVERVAVLPAIRDALQKRIVANHNGLIS